MAERRCRQRWVKTKTKTKTKQEIGRGGIERLWMDYGMAGGVEIRVAEPKVGAKARAPS